MKWVDHPLRPGGRGRAPGAAVRRGGSPTDVSGQGRHAGGEAGSEITRRQCWQPSSARDAGGEASSSRHLVPYRGVLPVKEGDAVRAGDALTEGPLDPQKVLQMQGVARRPGVPGARRSRPCTPATACSINDKHIEVIVRQMLRKRRVLEPGDTELLPGQDLRPVLLR